MTKFFKKNAVHTLLFLFSVLFMWILIYVIGIGASWDSSRYLFFASQFADYGNTYSMGYAPLFGTLLGIPQKLGCSAIFSLFMVYSLSLSITLSSYYVIAKSLSKTRTIQWLSMIALLCSPAFYSLIKYALSELTFCALLTAAMALALKSIRENKIHLLLLIICALLPLQRYIGIASSNICLFLTFFFLQKPTQQKASEWFQMFLIVNTPLLLVSIGNKLIGNNYFGPRNPNPSGSHIESFINVVETFFQDFMIETAFILLASGLIFQFINRVINEKRNWKDKLENPLANQNLENTLEKGFIVATLGIAMICGHIVAQVYSSTTVKINPIQMRYFTSFEPIFLLNILCSMSYLQQQIQNPKSSQWLPTIIFASILSIYPFQAYSNFSEFELSNNPRSIGYKSNAQLNDLVGEINKYENEKHVALYEIGKPHMPTSFLELGAFDSLSPGCTGVQFLVSKTNHYAPRITAAPQCKKGVQSQNRFYLLKKIEAEDRFTHIVIAKKRMDNKKQTQITNDLKEQNFIRVLNNKHFLLFIKDPD